MLLFSSCTKEWSEPDLYTINLSLASDPDSVDANSVYYYNGGMKLQMHLTVNSAGTLVKDQIWTNHTNFHLDKVDGTVSVIGKVINLSADTSLKIDDYPVIMRVYKNSEVLYDEVKVENSYSY
jgi:hypothetical protein